MDDSCRDWLWVLLDFWQAHRNLSAEFGREAAGLGFLSVSFFVSAH